MAKESEALDVEGYLPVRGWTGHFEGHQQPQVSQGCAIESVKQVIEHSRGISNLILWPTARVEN